MPSFRPIRILTLILALFLTFLQEDVPYANYTQMQEVCWEDADDIEEEAVIRTQQQEQKRTPFFSESVSEGFRIGPVLTEKTQPSHYCFEKQWLTCRRLRL